ncbi:MAG: hypothetical protein DI640_00885 [Sphingomonas taxi]|uniref:Uncharacterized protein n=1 Tax=Sphingomonas taxi TaxID=1549858 RepID=A0A2W4ZAP6_9SPHN|nr:MAG: hypothetical protein DI640_00885 [Sphingomonas taxi]
MFDRAYILDQMAADVFRSLSSRQPSFRCCGTGKVFITGVMHRLTLRNRTHAETMAIRRTR